MNTTTDIKPANTGETNQEIPIVANTRHLILPDPFDIRAKPIVPPTILWVPDTGKLKNVATNNQIQQPKIPNGNSSKHD